MDELKNGILLLDKCFPEESDIYKLFAHFKMTDCLPIIREFLKNNQWFKHFYEDIMKIYGESFYKNDPLIEKCPVCKKCRFLCIEESEKVRKLKKN